MIENFLITFLGPNLTVLFVGMVFLVIFFTFIAWFVKGLYK